MNTNLLKKFAQETRIKLLGAVETKLNYVLNGDSADLRDYTESIQILKKDIKKMGKEALIDKVAYTWFNRLMALRFMDANDYQPLGLKVISPKLDFTQPEILDEASQGNIPQELEVDRQRINDLLDGKIKVLQPQNEIYRMLLIASCNNLHGLFPFLFEKIKDYTELLLPDDLISELSIIQDFVQGMTEEDCQEVEILGWLYQFYISELNNELISSKRAYKKNELAPASQLFTPKWIVQYMVDNTLGQIWAEMNPSTQVLKELEFYITPSYKNQINRREKPIEEIKFLEPCVGSGHILAYAFDVFYMMYEEAGYAPSEIPILILQNNLFGIDIDPRATQIATFTLLMKGREKHRRFFRKIEKENFTPNIYYYEDFPQDSKFNSATVLGSLIRVTEEEADSVEIDESSLFGEKQQKLKNLYQLLSRKYDVVVTNPPYINSSRMEPSLKQYVNQTYPETKSDLFACFILRCLELSKEEGLTGYMTPFVWMFISSYQKLRGIIIEQHFINNLIQLEYSGFDGATVPICTFTLRNNPIEGKGSYIRLSDFKGSQNQAPKTLEAIQNPKCGWFYNADQKDFGKIPRSPIAFWLNDNLVNLFDNELLSESGDLKRGMTTSDNTRFLRFWSEISFNESKYDSKNHDDAKFSEKRWFPYNKGGWYRKWFGCNEYLVDWYNDGENIISYAKTINKSYTRTIVNIQYYFSPSITWPYISSSRFGVRFIPKGFLYDSGGPGLFNAKNKDIIAAFLNSNITQKLLYAIAPTLNFQIADISCIPTPKNISDEAQIKKTVKKLKIISKQEWNSRETSWDFTQNELIRVGSGAPVVSGRGMVDSELVDGERGMVDGEDGRVTSIEEAVERYKDYWTKKFIQLHRNEEELNARFIEIYGLQEELTPDVPLDEITILREELDQRKLKKISEKFSSGWELVDGDQWMVDGEGREAPVDGEGSEAPVNGGRWIVDGVSATRRDRGGEEESVISHESPVTTHYPPLPFDEQELIKQFTSYAVGCMMGRYSLEKPGLILANQGETISDYVRIVDSGQWMVDGELVDGEQWMVDGEGNKKQRYDKGLQGSENMAAEHGSGEDGLSGDGKDAEGRAVQSDGSDQTGSSEHSKQYSRGASERDAGISSLSSDRSRFTGRTGDPADPDRESPDAGGERSEADFDAGFPSEKTDPQSDEFTEKENKVQPLITKNQPQFLPDDDGIIPVLDSEWFEDDIVTQFYQFVRTVWGARDFQRNIDYIEKTLKKSIRDYFNRDFYNDHIRRYKKRPIYWLFSSPTGAFQVLVYLHRYTRNTLHNILNDYLRPYIDKLENHIDHLNHIVVEGSAREQTQARKDIVRTEKMIEELRKYDKEVLYPLAIRQIDIDLDDGVLVNYNKFGEAVKRVQGLNDPKKKAQVKKFDWIDGSEII